MHTVIEYTATGKRDKLTVYHDDHTAHTLDLGESTSYFIAHLSGITHMLYPRFTRDHKAAIVLEHTADDFTAALRSIYGDFDFIYDQERMITLAGWTQARADNQLSAVYESIYREQIEREFDWDSLQLEPDELDPGIGYAFLGTVFALAPSGKFWALWAAGNVDRREQIKDTAYFAALEYVAESHGFWIESGPDDLFIVGEV